MKKTKIKRTTILATLLIVIGAIGIGYAATLWVIDSTSHWITVSPIEAYMQYSLDNVTWVNVTSVSANAPWYARLRINYDGPSKTVRIEWALLGPSGWNPHGSDTTFLLIAGWNTIYVSSDGTATSNYNWGQQTSPIMEWNYRVRATISEM